MKYLKLGMGLGMVVAWLTQPDEKKFALFVIFGIILIAWSLPWRKQP